MAARNRCGCAMRCARRASIPPAAPAWSSIFAMPSWRVSKSSTTLSIRYSPTFPTPSTCDRVLSRGETPRLWVDAIAHVQMGRDKRLYRFVQDTSYGRTILSESHDADAMANAITDYVARRMIEREQSLAGRATATPVALPRSRGRFWTFVLGFIAGAATLFAIATLASLKY